MAGITIDVLDTARTPYTDTDIPILGIGGPPTQSYKGTLLEHYKYIQRKADQDPNNIYGANDNLINGKIIASVADNNLTIAIKCLNGDNPSTTNPVFVIFRHSTLADGSYVVRKLTSAYSFTVNAGNHLGQSANNVRIELFVVGVNDTDFQIGLVNRYTTNFTRFYVPTEWALQSTTGGNGGNNLGVIYTPTSATNKPITVLGMLEWTSGLPTAGQWSAGPTWIQNLTLTSILARYHERDNALTSFQETLALSSFEWIFDDGGVVLSAGIKGFIEVPFNFYLNRWTLLADVSGSMVADIWKDTYANYPPVIGDSICGTGTKPNISSSNKSQGTSFTNWTTRLFAGGDVLGFAITSCSTITKATLSLWGNKVAA